MGDVATGAVSANADQESVAAAAKSVKGFIIGFLVQQIIVLLPSDTNVL
jgi:hypothetical protein